MYNNIHFVYITFPNKEEARRIGAKLVEDRLAACVNIFDSMESIYRWEGKIESDNETVMIAKTHKSKVKALTKYVVSNHSYDCPCVISLPVAEEEGNSVYIKWLIQESKN